MKNKSFSEIKMRKKEKLEAIAIVERKDFNTWNIFESPSFRAKHNRA